MTRSLGACLFACALAWPVAVAAEDLPPNELGRVMILEYHKIDQPEERWTRPPDNFRRDLERLWERGYRLVALNNFLDGKIALPRGTTPVILTFDDSSPGQFKLIEKNGEWIVDPDCAVGILEAFERRHPEFGQALHIVVIASPRPDYRRSKPPAQSGIRDDFVLVSSKITVRRGGRVPVGRRGAA